MTARSDLNVVAVSLPAGHNRHDAGELTHPHRGAVTSPVGAGSGRSPAKGVAATAVPLTHDRSCQIRQNLSVDFSNLGPVRIFEMIYPGTWLQELPDRVAHEIQSLLYVMESHLADAALGVALFQEAQARRSQRPEWNDAASQVRRLVEMGIEVDRHWQRQAELQLPLTPEERWADQEQIRFDAERFVTRMQWDTGSTPEHYLHRLPFIHAHTVLYALDGVSKVLDVLSKMPDLPEGVIVASETFTTALPSVVEIRNSAHHIEDRGRPKGKFDKPLKLQPIDNDMIKSAGGALVLSSLNNNRLGYTLSDGYFSEVEISEASVEVAQRAIQGVLDALSWKGPRRLVPGR